MKNWPDDARAVIAPILQKLDVYGESPLILAQDGVTSKAMPIIEAVVKQGMLSAFSASHIACISCEGQANIIRMGSKGKQLFALCRVCGSNFCISEKDIQEFKATWISLSGWLAKIMEFAEEPEAISKNVFFLGNYNHGSDVYEVHLMRGCSADNAQENYQAILQLKSKPVIILSLSRKPNPCSSSDVRIVPLIECLAYTNKGFHLQLPARILSGADPVKQRAAGSRWDNDPLHKQKKVLEANIRSNLNSKFAPPMSHVDIKGIILSQYKDWLAYKKVGGESAEIKEEMLNEIIKAVLTDSGQSKRITGKYYAI